ncbi:type II toxin-antitoxin system RelE/ParE family toxin [Roseovarius autotrophicus]|uniref:type II toxin-antitoxin system RelE/ParE family toxin n=1 Tax=Roseovarius autotrophicus TaxID=2824121 RepID=UPI001B387165|nr:type II toxin-antitoxin system RelE/ParE family toxin [Roseovarius autotrophicus]
MVKPVLPRARARDDIDDAIAHYLADAGEVVALRFIDALEAAFAHLAAHPASGSLRYAYELELPGLRTWPLRDFPWLIFYIDTEAHVDVWRVLHSKRDIPAWMAEPAADT